MTRDRAGGLLVFAGFCLLSLVGYLLASDAVEAGLTTYHLLAIKLAEVVL